MGLLCGGCRKDLTGITYKMFHNLCWDCYEKWLNEQKVKENKENKEKEDIINKPKHYHEVGVDPISIGESILSKEEMNGFYKMNMIKYWHRAGKKEGNSKEQDLKKYEFYKKKLGENN